MSEEMPLRSEGREMNDSFHPWVGFTYFAAIIAFSMIFMHPICLAIGLFSAIADLCIRGESKKIRFILPLMLFAAVFNPAFNHEGVTILAYLPSENPLTAESIAYGIAASAMLGAVICRFFCFNKAMTSDKLMCIFGNIAPSLSLIFSMILRFIPLFSVRLKECADAQKCLSETKTKLSERIKDGIKVLSITLTRSLEDAIDTADSMKSRGYGSGRRTAFSNYIFCKRDIAALSFLLLLSAYIIFSAARGCFYFEYFPYIKHNEITPFEISAFAAYFLLACIPIAKKITEVIMWKKSKSEI